MFDPQMPIFLCTCCVSFSVDFSCRHHIEDRDDTGSIVAEPVHIYTRLQAHIQEPSVGEEVGNHQGPHRKNGQSALVGGDRQTVWEGGAFLAILNGEEEMVCWYCLADLPLTSPPLQKHDKDTGSCEVQVVRITARVASLADHLKVNKYDCIVVALFLSLFSNERFFCALPLPQKLHRSSVPCFNVPITAW